MASWWDNMFSGGAEREAADRNRAALGQYVRTGNNELDRGLAMSEGALRTGANNAGNYLGANYGLYDNLRTDGMGHLDRGRQDSLAALNSARGAYDPLAALGAKYGAGTDLYMDSLGVRGAEGNQRAVDSFQAGPGYEFARDQGLEALNRRRAASGMLNSGNADIDAIKFGTGLADQTYGSWQDRLAGLINPEMQATSGAAAGRAGVDTNIANLYQQDALARLGLEQGVTAGQAGTNTARAGNEVALGNSLGTLYTGDASNRVQIANNNASGQMSANNLQAQGEAQGSRNLFSAGMGLASLAAGGLGGGSFGSLFGAAGGGGGMGLGSLGSMTTGRLY